MLHVDGILCIKGIFPALVWPTVTDYQWLQISDDVSDEAPETTEDQVGNLLAQIALKDSELAAKHRQLFERERELQTWRKSYGGEPGVRKPDLTTQCEHGDSPGFLRMANEPAHKKGNNSQ
ncbi:hypothetical protein AG1IA_10048 [Rhizoctonia solani AG-1 IA]|uniref:Uncharacterized protein n=1 Tax=Thanatephorus cucumeris (strain AG1-IA) TaxID=983506 RepID=L8WGL4_THACA|nr:hypothetical protein AG1IA_10048 [Rhizoctonia solani AG-1 IA]